MHTSLMTYSFRRTVERGAMDIFSCIEFCQHNGIDYIEPWNKHLPQAEDDIQWVDQVRRAAADAGVRMGCVAIDGGHIYGDTQEARQQQHAYACHWLDVAARLGAPQVRIDAGGPEDMPDEAFAIIVAGFEDLIARGQERGVEILTENHWGPTKNPDNTLRLLEAVPQLGLLFDSNNWIEERREEAWEITARYARALHIKTFSFDADGNDPSVNLHKCIALLVDAGYAGVWGIESTPETGDEPAGVLGTRDLIRRELAALMPDAAS